MRISLPLLMFIFFLTTGSFGQDVYKYSQPEQGSDGWKTNHLGSQQIDTKQIYTLFDKLQKEKHKIYSILLVKNEELLIEEYFDTSSGNKQYDLRSVTKSIISILMGIAIDKGFITNVDDPISKYLKDLIPRKNLEERKERIKIRHLLTMSTGLDCNDWDKRSKGQEDRIYKKNNWLQYFLDLPMIHEPGTVSNYCTMGVVLTAKIISHSSGMTINKFAEKHLFNPLGITNMSWGHTSKKEVIPSGKRLYMTPRDMAKIGQLILNKGKWNQQEIVSEEWIHGSISNKTKIAGIDYGFLWWKIPFKANEKIIFSTVATGNGGQYIMIFPKMNMVVVFTGGAFNSQEDKIPFSLMNAIFLPAFMNNK